MCLSSKSHLGFYFFFVVFFLKNKCIISIGEMVTKQPLIRSMRTVKRETLKLISGWVSRSNDPQMVSLALLTYSQSPVCFYLNPCLIKMYF